MTALKSKRQHLSFSAEERPQFAQRLPADEVELVLPEPPSANRLFRNKAGGAGRVKTDAYRAWRLHAETVGSLQRPGRRDGPSDVSIWLPQTRKDTDNTGKAILDACKAIGVIADDGPRYIRNVFIIRDASRTDCRVCFRPTGDFGIPF